MHACSFEPLCRDTQLVHFAFSSVHLQCMEQANSTKILTSNVMIAITEHKVPVLYVWLDLERWDRSTRLAVV